VIFQGEARFTRATFHRNASFLGANFERDVGFRGVTFQRGAGFGEATFHGEAEFGEAEFQGWTGFGSATFQGGTVFAGATFKGDAGFSGATFYGVTFFDRAIVQRNARFKGARFQRARQLGPMLVHRALILDEAVFREHIQIEVSAAAVCCRQARFLAAEASLPPPWADAARAPISLELYGPARLRIGGLRFAVSPNGAGVPIAQNCQGNAHGHPEAR